MCTLNVWFGKTWIYIQIPCSIAPIRGSMNRHCEEPGYSHQILKGSSLNGHNPAIVISFDVVGTAMLFVWLKRKYHNHKILYFFIIMFIKYH